MKHKDTRIKVMNEILGAMKVIPNNWAYIIQQINILQ